MSTQFQVLISRLHVQAKTYQLEKVAESIHRLLQLARMSEKELGETLSPADILEANTFWSRILDTTKPSNTIEQKSARSIYAVIWSASREIPSPATRAQAGEYCDWVAVVCERYLTTHTAEVKALPPPVAKTPQYLRVVKN